MARRVKIDMTGVESYGRVSEGQHVAKIVAAEQVTTQGGNDAIKVAFEVTKGVDKGNRVIETYPLTETALWKLKGMLVALGMKCDGKITLDLDKLIGKALIIEVVHEEYNGNLRAKLSECKKFAADVDEDDEDFDDDEDDDEEEDDEEEPPKKKASPKKKAPAKKNPVEDDDDEDDEDFDEDDEEDEKPKKKAPAKKSTKKSPAKKAPAKKKVEEEDDDEDWDDDDEDWEED